MCTTIAKKRVLKTQDQSQSQSQYDFIMRYSSQSDFVSQQAIFLSQNFSQSMSTQYMQSQVLSQQFQASQISSNLESFIASLLSANSAEKILSIFTDSKKNEKHRILEYHD